MKLLSTTYTASVPGRSILYLILLLLPLISCKKYLDAKSDQRLSTPGSLDDLQAILDNVAALNRGVYATDMAGDEYYVTDVDFDGLTTKLETDTYIWKGDTDNFDDWNMQYGIVFKANTVLDHVDDMDNSDLARKEAIQGSALFFRAHSFFLLSQLYAKQFDPTTAATDWGIPLRLNANFNEASSRSTLLETYNRIIEDTRIASALLPKGVQYKTRPGKQAALGLLARVYLTMGNYQSAKLYADSCLAMEDTLMDYKELDSGAENPFSLYNPEVIFHAVTSAQPILQNYIARIDSSLFRLYDDNDLRKTFFFKDNGDNTVGYKTTYNADPTQLFHGIATDEIWLIRAESNSELGHVDEAMNDLNTLLIRRWKDHGSFVPVTAVDAPDALNKIWQERRKELIFRGLRWSDIRRQNKAGAQISLKRILKGQDYVLPSQDERFTFLIPLEVIRLSGIPQNER